MAKRGRKLSIDKMTTATRQNLLEFLHSESAELSILVERLTANQRATFFANIMKVYADAISVDSNESEGNGVVNLIFNTKTREQLNTEIEEAKATEIDNNNVDI